MICCVRDCKSFGSRAIKINIPAQGYAIAQHRPIGMILDLAFCPKHADAAKVDDFLTDDSRASIDAALLDSGKAQADFKRAWLKVIRRDGQEFQEFKLSAAIRDGT